MIKGIHAMFFTSEPEALREFLRDKLGLSGTDIGGGWLNFDVPTAEMGVHPAMNEGEKIVPSGTHDISFYCDDIEATVKELTSRGVAFLQPVECQGFGKITRFEMPGGVQASLYEASYPQT